MRKLVVATVLFSMSCTEAGGERVVSAACKPAVNVTVPSPGTAKSPQKAPPATMARREAVQVYWDVSRSMSDFAAVGKPRNRSEKTTTEPWTDDLTPVVTALDSSVLLRAHASVIEHFGVGESIQPLASARPALRPQAKRTALHLAAEQIGTALAAGSAQAAIVISDMELDTPPRGSGANATVCRGVPLPSTAEAGSLFGRCFENAVLASDGPSRTRTHLLVHVFRKSTHGRELFILVIATDRAFGRAISDEVARALDFTRHVIFDSGAVAAANVRGCTLAAAEPEVRLRTAAGCGAKCFDANAVIRAECELSRGVTDAWIQPAGRGQDGVQYESLKRKPGEKEQRAVARFTIPCSTPPGRVQSTISFAWNARTPWSQDGNGAFAQRASVRDLFDSLTDAIVRTVAPRRLHIGIDLAK